MFVFRPTLELPSPYNAQNAAENCHRSGKEFEAWEIKGHRLERFRGSFRPNTQSPRRRLKVHGPSPAHMLVLKILRSDQAEKS